MTSDIKSWQERLAGDVAPAEKPQGAIELAMQGQIEDLLEQNKNLKAALNGAISKLGQVLATASQTLSNSHEPIASNAVPHSLTDSFGPAVAEWVNEEQGFQYLTTTRLPDGTQLYAQSVVNL